MSRIIFYLTTLILLAHLYSCKTDPIILPDDTTVDNLVDTVIVDTVIVDTVVVDTVIVDCSAFDQDFNDTIGYGGIGINDVYSLDIDSNGEIDVVLRGYLRTSPGGAETYIKLIIIDELFLVELETVLVPICQDTLNWSLDPSVEYYQNTKCDEVNNPIRVDTIEMAKIFQVEELDNFEVSQNLGQEVFLEKYDGIGADGIFPGAIFNDISSSIFDVDPLGWLVFVKDNGDLYALEMAFINPSNNFCCQSDVINIIKLRRIDCE